MARRVRLRTVLILVNLFVQALPLAGVQVLRIYESALVRQTESELTAQGVAIASFYRASFQRLTPRPTDARLDNDHGVSVCWTDPPPIHLATEAASLDAVLGQLAKNAREHAGDKVNITIEVRRVDETTAARDSAYPSSARSLKDPEVKSSCWMYPGAAPSDFVFL